MLKRFDKATIYDLHQEFEEMLKVVHETSTTFKYSRKEVLEKLYHILSSKLFDLSDSKLLLNDMVPSINILRHYIDTHSKYVADEKFLNIDTQTNAIT